MPLFWLVHIVFIALLSRQFYRAQTTSPILSSFWYGLSAKVLTGLLLGIIYKQYYHGGDTWGFFEGAIQLSNMAISDPAGYLKVLVTGSIPDQLSFEVGYSGQPRALLMIRILSLPVLLTGGSYWLSSIYFSLFAFSGMWTLATHVVRTYKEAAGATLVAFVFLPTVCFWSSGITKETVYMGGFGFILSWFWPYFAENWNHRWYHWLCTVLILTILIPLKYYYVAVAGPVLIATIVHRRFSFVNTGGILSHLTWLAIFGILIVCASLLHPNLNLTYVTELMRENAQQILASSTDTAAIHFFEHADPVTWAVINLPWAVFTGLFRPNLGDWGNLLQNMVVVECLVITVFTAGKLRTLKNKKMDPVWLPCMVYVVLLAGMLTLSTPNFGTLVRFKTAFLPVFTFMVLYQNDWWLRFREKCRQVKLFGDFLSLT